MSDTVYDVCVVGGGIAGAIIAAELGSKWKVLILESGVAIPPSREAMMDRFYTALAKGPTAPYAPNPNAPVPDGGDIFSNQTWKDPSKTKYFDHSESTLPFGSNYERLAGGTMWHWMGTSLRFMPNDFRVKDLYQVGDNWPIGYDELIPFYKAAEEEMGVSANVEHQIHGGIHFPPDYSYPNPEIPISRSDQFFADGLKAEKFEGYDVTVRPTPAGRNSRPYQNRRVCAGNTNCVPICPIGAKYDATVTLHRAFNTGGVEMLARAVATKVLTNESRHEITGVEYVRYEDPSRPSAVQRGVAKARIYVIASNAIETPKLLLMSGFDNPNLGANLMDHIFYLRWGLAPKPIFGYRGPQSTAGIESLRDGDFRKRHSSYRIELGNDGWGLATFDPGFTVEDWVDGPKPGGTNTSGRGQYGKALIKGLNGAFTRQCRIGFEFEQLPQKTNRVALSSYKDELGIPRPKITYNFSDYEKDAFVVADKLTDQIFTKLGVEPHAGGPNNDPNSPARFHHQGKDFNYLGAGHLIGTYRMGSKEDRDKSVVNSDQQYWGIDNLYLVGSGVFPTCGTANPTLTLAALCFRAAKKIGEELGEPEHRIPA